ncbi:hypothetical protein [Brucella tritici]|uniref:DUF2591 domain-containing protein n=1 Tax=Brucella tritici TaxID=94626 RepID=A0A6L3YB37_9HYPH|nr:hypothetical protein [Brucella tritici]KAB2680527.1 hypothetical protein F9L08_20980 [Brucella tritici]
MTSILITRLSRLDGPDDDIDAEIAMQACGFTRRNLMEDHPDQKPLWEYFDQERNCTGRHGPMIRRYTASVDAAIALAERMLPGWDGIIPLNNKDEAWLWKGGSMNKGHRVTAATPAIALCIAILRAKEAGYG